MPEGELPAKRRGMGVIYLSVPICVNIGLRGFYFIDKFFQFVFYLWNIPCIPNLRNGHS